MPYTPDRPTAGALADSGAHPPLHDMRPFFGEPLAAQPLQRSSCHSLLSRCPVGRETTHAKVLRNVRRAVCYLCRASDPSPSPSPPISLQSRRPKALVRKLGFALQRPTNVAYKTPVPVPGRTRRTFMSLCSLLANNAGCLTLELSAMVVGGVKENALLVTHELDYM